MRVVDYTAFGEQGSRLRANAGKISRAFGRGFKPPPRVTVSEWAQSYRRFGDDAPLPGPWRNETAPYLVEIMDRLSPFDPCSEVAIMKCAQSGGSAAAENLIGYVADVAPGPMLFVQATVPAAHGWAKNKLWAMINATPRLSPKRRGAVLPLDGGSTKDQIGFARGGYLLLAGANSAATLTEKTVRYAIEDDLDQFPDDLDGQGSPEGMVDQRLKVFRTLGLSKRLKIGTPTVKGASKISAAHDRGDRRRFYLVCPACECRFDPAWEPHEGGARDVHWPEGEPSKAYLVAPCCGGVLEHWQKKGMMRPDGWLATVEIDGVKPPRVLAESDFQTWRTRDVSRFQPSYHIGGLVTVFDTWAGLAAGYDAAKGDPNKLKAWVMLALGEPFEVRGEAPDHEKLAKLVEQDWGRGRRLPFGAVAATMGVDVQGDGVYCEVLAWGPDAESWSIEAAFLPGPTDVAGEGAWAELEKVARRPVVYPGGQELPLDQICVDAGYHTAAAEAFCKGHANRLAVFGRAGWTLPVLGRAQALRHETLGKRAGQASRRPEDRAYLVGTYGVKLTLYGYLRHTLKVVEAELRGERLEGRGRCHFGPELAADFFEQITAETIETKIAKNGYPRREWRPIKSRPNHFLDCRVYNHAAAERLKLDTLTAEEWDRLRLERYAQVSAQGELFDGIAAPANRPPQQSQANAVRDSDGAGWVDTGGDWL